MNKFEFHLFEYEKLFFSSQELVAIVVQGNKTGEMTILYNHAPIIVDLEKTVVKCRFISGQEKNFWVEKGIFSFHENSAKIMASKVKNHHEEY